MGQTDIKLYAIGIVALVAGVSFIGVMGNLVWDMPNPVGNFWLNIGGDDSTVPPAESLAPIAFELQKKGAEGTHPSATAYVWYDWDGDGQVDLGTYPDSGEIETCSLDDNNKITTSVHYPVGEQVWFQLHATNYQVLEIARTVPEPAAAWNGVDALTVPAVQMVLLETSITVSVSASGTGGTVAMVTGTGDYNYTTYGTSPSIDLMITCATGDAGIGQPAYRHWVTGKSYHGSFIAIKMALTEKSNVIFSDYDYQDDDGTSLWTVWDLNSLVFNDAEVDDDGDYVLEFGLTIVGDFDWDEINIYDSVLETNFGQEAYGTADGQETDLDFVE